ncbi:MAG: energy transducer TonB [Bdellovibrionales bacterium]|nr:energy transducer TonB [Bdellovibrionales bacterium]
MAASQRTFFLLSAIVHCSFLVAVAHSPLRWGRTASPPHIRFRIAPPISSNTFSLAPSILTEAETTKPQLKQNRNPFHRIHPISEPASQPVVQDLSLPRHSLPTKDEHLAPPEESVQERDDYLTLVLAALENAKQYPRRALRRRVEGTALLSLEIAKTGGLKQYSVEQSSGSEILDEEVREMVKRAHPFPPFPPELSESVITFKVPIQFQMNFR